MNWKTTQRARAMYCSIKQPLWLNPCYLLIVQNGLRQWTLLISIVSKYLWSIVAWTHLNSYSLSCIISLGATVYKSMRKYGKCLSGLSRQALNVFLHGMKNFIKSICSNPTKKSSNSEYLEQKTFFF